MSTTKAKKMSVAYCFLKNAHLGERQVKAYPRTQTDRRTVGKANGRRIIGAFRKTLFGSTFRLCRPIWISRMTKPAEDHVAGEFNPAGRLNRTAATVSPTFKNGETKNPGVAIPGGFSRMTRLSHTRFPTWADSPE